MTTLRTCPYDTMIDEQVSVILDHFVSHTEEHQCHRNVLTLKVLNFWKFTSYCSLKPLWSGMGEVVPARTSLTLHSPSPPTVHQLSRLALQELRSLYMEVWYNPDEYSHGICYGHCTQLSLHNIMFSPALCAKIPENMLSQNSHVPADILPLFRRISALSGLIKTSWTTTRRKMFYHMSL